MGKPCSRYFDKKPHHEQNACENNGKNFASSKNSFSFYSPNTKQTGSTQENMAIVSMRLHKGGLGCTLQLCPGSCPDKLGWETTNYGVMNMASSVEDLEITPSIGGARDNKNKRE